MNRYCAVVFLIALCITLTGCPSGSLVGSRIYKPQSDTEEYAFDRAVREIYPDDVRADFASHDSSRVAWPGIVLEAVPQVLDTIIEVNLTIEHHYYDWIEDFSVQHERIFLSPRGEGLFATTIYLSPETAPKEINGSVGDMVIVYGIPTGVTDSTVSVQSFYVRHIAAEWFATDIFDYGRPGDSMTVLRVPQ